MTRARARWTAVLLIAATFAALAGSPAVEPAAAQTTTTAPRGPQSIDRAQRLMLLVDTSGSMSEDDGTGRIKIDGARQALIDFVRAVPPGTPVGLRTYPGGPDSENGCSKGKLIVPPTKPDLATVDAEIRFLSPGGDTPTSAALRAAAADLTSAGGGSGTIVLVSDGESNCGPDPCNVAKELQAAHIDVTVNTVGFRISQSGRTQLQCIADATNGRYGDVDDNQQLVDELNRLARALVEVRLNYPPQVKAAVGQGASGAINVVATFNAVGAQAVADLKVDLAFDIDHAPTVLNPRRLLGNLPPGTSTSATWTFRPPLEEQDRTLEFTVTAISKNSAATQAKGRIALTAGYSLADAGPLLKDKKRVVILGDSYSAGEGGADYDPHTDTETNHCHRSPNTYGTKLFPHVDNYACSGAVTHDVTYQNDHNQDEVAQVNHIENTPYDLALMSIGGNDAGFEEIAKFCVTHFECHKSETSSPQWRTYEELIFARINALGNTELDTLRQVEEALNSSANLTHRPGPAPLVVMGYPSAVPLAAGQRYLLCSAAFDIHEMHFFQQMLLKLNGMIQGVVTALRAEGRPVYFVPDVIDSFQPDHTYCADPDEQWIHRLSVVDTVVSLTKGMLDKFAANPFGLLDPIGIVTTIELKLADNIAGALPIVRRYQEQLHPNLLGYKAMTKELVRWSTSPEARVPVTRAADPKNPTPGDLIVLKQGTTPVIGSTVVLQPAGEVQVQMTGLMPQSTAALVLQSDPTVLDQVIADENGRAVFRARVPSGSHIGSHKLVVYLTRADGTVATVTRPVNMRRARLWWDIPLAVAGGLLLIATFVLLWRRRRLRLATPPT